MAARTPVYQHITTDQQLREFCEASTGSKFIGFDTEFVSENCYRPELCLLQVATDSEFAIIDTMVVDVQPFWDLLVSGEHVTVVHAAREEFLFCLRASGKWPSNLFDVQFAAGMVGLEYPASYGNLVSRLLGKRIDKGETRTDWRRRPLTNRQMDYALSDVLHLKGLYDNVMAQLEKLGRVEWVREEMTQWQMDLSKVETEPQWQRVSGISNLKSRALAIVRELWIIRDAEAKERNRASRRVLPDDLIVELAKRGSAEPKRIKAIRGFDSRVSKSMLTPISLAIGRANDLPDAECPNRMPRGRTMNLGMLGQFLTTALNVVCKTQKIAPNLVGTAQNLRTMAAWRMGLIELNEAPDLATGWRAEIVGGTIDKILDGSIAIRVGDPKSDHPLVIEQMDDN